MNPWWASREWYCLCQGDDQWVHVHHAESPHSCARCRCQQYREFIPQSLAIRILIGPEMTDAQAADVLLGKVL